MTSSRVGHDGDEPLHVAGGGDWRAHSTSLDLFLGQCRGYRVFIQASRIARDVEQLLLPMLDSSVSG